MTSLPDAVRRITGLPRIEPESPRHWIAGAIKKPGSFTKQATRAGKSVAAYAKEKVHAPGVTGKRARLALALKKMNRRGG